MPHFIVSFTHGSDTPGLVRGQIFSIIGISSHCFNVKSPLDQHLSPGKPGLERLAIDSGSIPHP